VILVVTVLACTLVVPLAGGRLRALADVRLRALAWLWGALGLQLLITVVPVPWPAFAYAPAHMLSYVLAGVFFIANRSVPGLWLVGVGGLLNFLAIAANGGVMPASETAFATAGLSVSEQAFANSAVAAAPRLRLLGDVFALPASWPLANVFSVGDVLIAVGAALALWRLCHARVVPPHLRDFAELLELRPFRRLWLAFTASNVGDFMYGLAVAVTLAGEDGATSVFATLLLVQVGSAALAALLVGPLVDRWSRTRVMVVADLVRCGAVATLLAPGDIPVVHLYAVAVLLGVLHAAFQPAFLASLPNVVPRADILRANALVSASYHTSVMVGPALGGLLVVALGPHVVFGINAASFLVSAALIAGVRTRLQASRIGFPVRSSSAGVGEGFAALRRIAAVRPLFLVAGLAVFAAALKMPLEPAFVMDTLGGSPRDLGLVGSAWGLGMVLAALAAPALARRVKDGRTIAWSIAVVGVALALASRSPVLAPVVALWVVGGVGNALAGITWDSTLQELVADEYRGRVLAAFEAVLQTGLLAGLALSTVAVRALGVRGTYLAAGVLLLGAAVVARRVTVPAVDRVPTASAAEAVAA
jgi:MFS family permease